MKNSAPNPSERNREWTRIDANSRRLSCPGFCSRSFAFIRGSIRFACGLAAVVFVAIAFTLRAPAAESPSVLLQKGIFAEETEGNVDAAIKIYEQITTEAATNRSVVAQAQYRLAVCYQKKGNKEQAIKLLNELVQQPSADADISKKARGSLAELGVAPSEAVSVRRVPLSGTPGWIVAVSPDGRLAGYQPYDSNELFVQDLVTGKTQLVDKDADMQGHSPPARFSPDGQWIAYDYQEAGIHVAKTDGTETRTLLAGTKNDGKKHWNEVAGWSADGTQVIAGLWNYTRNSRVATALDIKTGAAKEVLPALGTNDRLSDNARYIARRGESYHKTITLLDIKSGREETVLDHDADRVVGWVFGDTQFVYTKNEIHGVEIWVVDVQDGKTVGKPRLISSDSVKSFSRGASRCYPLGLTRDGRIFYTVERGKPAADELWVLEGFLPSKSSGTEVAIFETEIPSTELVTDSENVVVDQKIGVAFKLPAGWQISSAARRSNGGNGIGLKASEGKKANIGFAYRETNPWVEGPSSSGPFAHIWGAKQPAPSEVDAWLRAVAERIAQAAAQGAKDYQRDAAGFASRIVGGRKALAWSESYTVNDVKWNALRVYVYGEKAHAQINLTAPASDFDAVRLGFERLVESFRLP